MSEIYIYCRTCRIEFPVTNPRGATSCPHCRATYQIEKG